MKPEESKRLQVRIQYQNLKFNKDGLIPAIVQDHQSGEILMLAYMNIGAIRHTIETGQAHFWSRSRQSLWYKGETSGNSLTVVEMWVDCDQDSLLLKVNPSGPACHTGNHSCFFQAVALSTDS